MPSTWVRRQGIIGLVGDGGGEYASSGLARTVSSATIQQHDLEMQSADTINLQRKNKI